MLADRLEPGKKWIESELRAAIHEKGSRVEGEVEWRSDFNSDLYTLQATVGGKATRWTFTYEDVTDCVRDRDAQKRIQRLVLTPRSGISRGMCQ